MKYSRALVAIAGLLLAATCSFAGNLLSQFLNPPEAARPWVYWFWLSGNITREGITADLEAMRRVGIGGVLIMEVDQGTARPGRLRRPRSGGNCSSTSRRGRSARAGSEHEQRRRLVRQRRPLDPAPIAMQKMVWTETSLEGPRHVDLPLAQPESVAPTTMKTWP